MLLSEFIFLADLKKISENQQAPIELDSYVKKLNNSRRRVMLVNNILQNTQVKETIFNNTMILLVDGDRHGDGYVIIIVVNANKILVLPIRRVSVQVNTPLPLFFRE